MSTYSKEMAVVLWWDETGRMDEADGQGLFAVSIDVSSFFFHSVVLLSLLSFFLLSFDGYCLLAFSTQGETFMFVWVLVLHYGRLDSHIPVVLSNNK
jgi:hypothetical protein